MFWGNLLALSSPHSVMLEIMLLDGRAIQWKNNESQSQYSEFTWKSMGAIVELYRWK